MKILNVRKTDVFKLCKPRATACIRTQFAMIVYVGGKSRKLLVIEQHDDVWKEHYKMCIKIYNDLFPDSYTNLY